jgi:hypothetical protein
MPNNDSALSDSDYIARLQKAIRRVNGCESKYLETVTVSESSVSFHKHTVWQGEVAVFEVHGHPQAARAYAWLSREPNETTRYVVVLEIPPITSPQKAVQAAMTAQIINRTSVE